MKSRLGIIWSTWKNGREWETANGTRNTLKETENAERKEKYFEASGKTWSTRHNFDDNWEGKAMTQPNQNRLDGPIH